MRTNIVDKKFVEELKHFEETATNMVGGKYNFEGNPREFRVEIFPGVAPIKI